MTCDKTRYFAILWDISGYFAIFWDTLRYFAITVAADPRSDSKKQSEEAYTDCHKQ
jgi:hypothetical protein